MRLKIVFSEPPEQEFKAEPDEKLVLLHSPYRSFKINEEAQQQNDYTCGPATVKMVASYFDSMKKQNFCDAPISNPELWQEITQASEMKLAANVNTNEADSSAIPNIRKGLMQMGVRVFDDTGFQSFITPSQKRAHK